MVNKGAGRRTRSLRKWLILLALLAGIYFTRTFWLRQIGEFLVRAEAPQTADVAVVLAGDGYGHRILKAAQCVKEGYVPLVLVDGPRGFYGFDESKLAINFAVDEGFAREIFVPLPTRSRSTLDEARHVDSELRRRNMHKALIVTSNYHTRRAGAIFRHVGSPGIQYIMVASRDEDFAPESWWHSRDAEKVVFFEYVKLVNWWVIDGK